MDNGNVYRLGIFYDGSVTIIDQNKNNFFYGNGAFELWKHVTNVSNIWFGNIIDISDEVMNWVRHIQGVKSVSIERIDQLIDLVHFHSDTLEYVHYNSCEANIHDELETDLVRSLSKIKRLTFRSQKLLSNIQFLLNVRDLKIEYLQEADDIRGLCNLLNCSVMLRHFHICNKYFHQLPLALQLCIKNNRFLTLTSFKHKSEYNIFNDLCSKLAKTEACLMLAIKKLKKTTFLHKDLIELLAKEIYYNRSCTKEYEERIFEQVKTYKK
jgi:hypothetical protein